MQAQSPAEAPTFAIERFEPLPAPGLNLINVATARLLASGRVSVGAAFHYSDRPLSLIRTDEARTLVDTIIDDRFVVDVSAAVGLFGFLELGVALPITTSQTGGGLGVLGHPDLAVDGASVGDVRVVPRVRFWDPAATGGFGLHVLVPISLPTGDDTAFDSDGDVRVQPTLGLDYRHDSGFALAFNVGWLHRPTRSYLNLVRGSELRWAVALEVPTTVAPLSVLATVFGAVALEDNLDPLDLSRPIDDRDAPVEVLGAARLRVGADFMLLAGAGAGVSGAVGAPDLRVFVSAAYTPTTSTRDRDGDGIRDVDDRCPDEAEDFDGFEDDDGCPDLDNDGDGIPDDLDACPDEPEDFDGFEDDDGCPDPDNDKDGILDVDDRCPHEPEDFDGFEDDDGCPDPDNDGDGLPDHLDRCPNEPEDYDGFEDDDGCPDPDNDKDGILDVNDLCPDFPETFNGFEDTDGCPDTTSPYVRILPDEIRLLRPIYFSRRQATMSAVSRRVLDDVADVILANSEITGVRIEGHTDDLGDPGRNQSMSERRARAVRSYLIKRGVEPTLLEAVGFGATRPVAAEVDEVGRAQNRRVEIKITEVSGRPVAPSIAPAPPEQQP